MTYKILALGLLGLIIAGPATGYAETVNPYTSEVTLSDEEIVSTMGEVNQPSVKTSYASGGAISTIGSVSNMGSVSNLTNMSGLTGAMASATSGALGSTSETASESDQNDTHIYAIQTKPREASARPSQNSASSSGFGINIGGVNVSLNQNGITASGYGMNGGLGSNGLSGSGYGFSGSSANGGQLISTNGSANPYANYASAENTSSGSTSTGSTSNSAQAAIAQENALRANGDLQRASR